METNYELKHKCLLVPLKAVLLVLAMTLIGFTANAQVGKSVRVATDQQLIEALENPAVGSVELEPGYYAYLNIQATPGTKVRRGDAGNGNRDTDGCTYFIVSYVACFDVENPGDFETQIASAGTLPDQCPNYPPVDCCPPANPSWGTWMVVDQPTGSTVNFLLPLNEYSQIFEVNAPGVYTLAYEWDDPTFTYEYAYVETEYFFFGPEEVELEADDVCGLTTWVDVLVDMPDDFTYDLEWFLNDLPYAGPEVAEGFWLTVDPCGLYELTLVVHTLYEGTDRDCPDSTSIIINFACEPIADAGPDVNVCNDLCYYSLHGSTGLGEPPLPPYSPTYAYSWVQMSGPGTLDFDDEYALTTYVCREEFPPVCSYGEYLVEFQVQNGKCYDEDEMYLRFYQQPIADAGDDQHLCNTFSFSLNAVPFEYCGTEGVNYWATRYWEVVSTPDPAAIVTFTDPNDPNTTVTITSTDPDACIWGPYEFKWNEENSKGRDLGGCFDDDNVVYTIYEDPAPDAGDDMAFCNTFAFTLYGIGDEPCYEETVVVYTWEKTSEPGNCLITFNDANILTPLVTISECDDECEYGEYVFTLNQANGYYNENEQFVEVCESSDEVSVWVLEDVVANAGDDLRLCNDFAFTLTAIPTDFCGEAGVNYFAGGYWEYVGDIPATVTFDDSNDPETGVTITDAPACPWGKYTFRWNEYNKVEVNNEEIGCEGYDDVDVYIYEQPDVDAGDDLYFCNTFEFQLDGTYDELCTEGWSYIIEWELISQPGTCDVDFETESIEDPLVYISECSPCQYGEYVFRMTQYNGYYAQVGDMIRFFPICEDSDEVSVWIFEQPMDVDAGEDLYLCNDFAFSLTAVGYDYCGDFGVNYNNYYSWTLESQPEGAQCDVVITDPTSLETDVLIGPCAGECKYGEYIFRFTEFNGMYEGVCETYDLVSVFIFEQPVADAGDDVNACVDIAYTPYCYTMTATYDFCYSMYGVWTKSCGPGDVVFTDVNDPASEACFQEPGRYILTWTVWNDAEECEASDDVIFDLLEQPTAWGEYDELLAECDELCIDLGLAYIDKYEYFGTDAGDCPNYDDQSYWELIDGPGPVTFADDTDPATELCVTVYGCYTVRWNEVNVSVDGETECADYFDVFVVFVETPVPDAGPDASLCGNCYEMQAEPYLENTCTGDNGYSYWEFVSYEPPVDPCTLDQFVISYSEAYEISDILDPNAEICVVDDCLGTHYGTYGFKWVNGVGECEGEDIVYITFNKIPEEVALEGSINPSNCYDGECPNCEVSCLYPDGYRIEPKEPGVDPETGVIEVCAGSCISLGIDWSCFCNEGPIPGYTYEWSFIGPAGSYMQAEPYWYDCDDNCWRGSDDVFICFGECCDTARLYLTITSPQGCTTTEEWKFFVNHLPCANIEGPDVAEVDMISTYCNVCPEEYDMDCLLYTWTAEHCGQIVEGQGTECIEVLWTDYNVNGGWGEITLTVFDTCTGCCNYDYMDVKVWPAGTIGDATLAGYVYYHNNGETPLNGVEIQLWNGDVPVMTTTSFNDLEDNGMGYFEFTGLNATTSFGLTATYDAPWYGANATDALAVELKAINNLPVGFIYDDVVAEAMDANNSSTINATDALWIKQRAINMIGYFPAGNWAFDPAMSTQAVDGYEIFALNVGDANRSNNPNSMKSMPAIDLVTDGTINVVTGQVFELPVRIADANTFGAMTLTLDYNPALYEVVDVVAAEGMIFNINENNVGIAFSNVNPMTLAENDVVVTLKVKAISEVATAEAMFSVGMNSEFADAQAKVIEPVTLKSFGVTTSPAAVDYFLSANRPNPFNNSTFIEYTMPEGGKVKLSVLDMLGQEIAVLVDATQTAGSYTVEFSAAGLATGVYLYKITVDGETRDFISTQRMVISQ
ncbi:MAG: T9SS type A sorting domain-containing protein [Bacteroidales bacterium]|nr:T9SS type A sorting domain-containing protein [Bacteroidales bacterium]